MRSHSFERVLPMNPNQTVQDFDRVIVKLGWEMRENLTSK